MNFKKNFTLTGIIIIIAIFIILISQSLANEKNCMINEKDLPWLITSVELEWYCPKLGTTCYEKFLIQILLSHGR